jgi:hypothetical protein
MRLLQSPPDRWKEQGLSVTFQEKGPGGLGKGPCAGGPKLKNRQPFCGWVIRSPMGLDLLHPNVLDADLLTQQGNLPPQSLEFRLVAELWIKSRPAQGSGQGQICERDGAYGRRTDAPGPGSGKWKGMGQGNWRDEPSPERCCAEEVGDSISL